MEPSSEVNSCSPSAGVEGGGGVAGGGDGDGGMRGLQGGAEDRSGGMTAGGEWDERVGAGFGEEVGGVKGQIVGRVGREGGGGGGGGGD